MAEESAPTTSENSDESSDGSEGNSPGSLDELFSSLAMDRSEHDKRYADLADSPNYARSLQSAAAEYLAEPEQFKPGDLVTWKTQLRNRRFPAYGRPAVVLEVVPDRKSRVKETSHVVVDEPIELTLGIIDGDGDFMLYHYDHRRFTRWSQSVADS